MMKRFASKRVKKQEIPEETRESARSPVLSSDDELFLQHIISEEGTPPPLPERPIRRQSGDPTGNDGQLVLFNGNYSGSDSETEEEIEEAVEEVFEGQDGDRQRERHHPDATHAEREEKGGKKSKWSFFQRGEKKDKKRKPSRGRSTSRHKEAKVDKKEEKREEQDITAVLDNLNLEAEGNKAFNLSKESQVLVQKFTVVLKDLINGVPTAYDDLIHLLDSSQSQLQRSYKHLPPFMQKLVKSLPKRLSSTLAPEMLATAAGMQGVSSAEGGKSKFKMPDLMELVTKPSAVIGMLKAIMNFLKLRWPAFMGTSVLWSLALFVLLFVFWYCHKRGREARIDREREASGQEAIDRIHGDGTSTVSGDKLIEGASTQKVQTF